MSVELDGANNIVKTDTISEVTSANGVTVDGLSIKDSKLVTANSVIEANMSADSVDSDSYVDGSIDTAHIADNQITLAKMAGGTDGNLITYDASGDPAYVVTGTSGHFLKSAGAGAAPSFSASGKVLQVVHVYNASISSINATSYADVTNAASDIVSIGASSTFLVEYNPTGFHFNNVSNMCHLLLVRTIGGSATSVGTAAHNSATASMQVDGADDNVRMGGFGLRQLDSPSQAAGVTINYKVQVKVDNTDLTCKIGGNENGQGFGQSFTIMEIGA